MKMRRTIKMRGNSIIYQGSRFSSLLSSVKKFFKIKNSYLFKYVITIEEGTQCRIEPRLPDSYFYTIRGEGYPTDRWEELHLCRYRFDELFFVPEIGKRYDITVKRRLFFLPD